MTRQESLRLWLASQQFDALIEVLQSRAFLKEAESVNAQIKANAGAHPLYEETAAVVSRDAIQIRFAISLLKKLRAQTEPFQTATAIPD